MALQAEYMLIPPVTKGYTTACVITTLAVVSYCHVTTRRFNNIFF